MLKSVGLRTPVPYHFWVELEPNLLRWCSAWQKASAFLAAERAERLRHMTDDDVRAAIAAIFTGTPATPADLRQDGALNGLVEQQRLFRKLK